MTGSTPVLVSKCTSTSANVVVWLPFGALSLRVDPDGLILAVDAFVAAMRELAALARRVTGMMDTGMILSVASSK